MEELTLEGLAAQLSELRVVIEKHEKRIEALENQAYILYLQLNAVTKQIIEKGTLDKDQLTKDMDELNDQLYKVAQEGFEEEEAAGESAAE